MNIISNTDMPDINDSQYNEVMEAIKDGCAPKRVNEQGEWHWWCCTCADKRHSSDKEETYFGGRQI